VSEHRATIDWSRSLPEPGSPAYSREHTWTFAGGVQVRASSAPEYAGDPSCANPEEGLVAAVSSCHMLTFLALCAKKRLIVERYTDAAVGTLDKNDEGRLAITRIELHPRVTFVGEPPGPDALAALHDKAHQHCFIANSVRCDVAVL
jgi:organic hydroperoxide reductase OsmC/OhrA